MANRNQQRGGQHYQDLNYQGSRNQMGQGGHGGRNQQSAFQNNQGQYGGNYGADTNYRGPHEYGNQGSQGEFQGYGDQSNTRFGNDAYSGSSQGSAYGNYGLSRDAGYNPRETNANDNWEPENSRGPKGYGHSQSYGGSLGYQDEAQRGGHYHDPDYCQWRDEQIRGLDNDYKAWRDERYSKFSNEFGEWRKSRKDNQPVSSSSSRGSADVDAPSKSK